MSGFHLAQIARLARLQFKDSELRSYESQVEGILRFAEELKEVNVDGVTPTSHPFSLSNVFRDDVPQSGVSIEQFVKQSPKARGRFFEVPKIIEDKS